MSSPKDQPNEHPSTYVVQDRANQEEITRLALQDQLLNTMMGGVLPELADPASLRRVLDVGCGTGGWLLETARTYRSIEHLVGCDISGQMMEYARQEAKNQGLEGRVQFETMDALRMLEFPAASFDLVNHRLAQGWLRTWEWSKLLGEYQRVARPGGIIRLTEGNVATESNSGALTQLWEIVLLTMYNSGRYFEPRSDGVTSQLASLLAQHRFENIHSKLHTLVYPAGTAHHQSFYQDTLHLFHVMVPFFQKWTRVPTNYQQIYEQALSEMQQPDFVGTWTFLTVWGTNPE